MNEAYVAADHLARDNDAYAFGKYQVTLRWLRDLPRGAPIANIGCGSGVFNRLAAAAGFRVLAFEPDPDAFAIADATRPAGCVVENRGLAELEEVGAVGALVLHDVLEHIEDDAQAVAHLARLCSDGCQRIVLSVPALPRLFGYHDEQLGHFRRYTRRSLSEVLCSRFDIGRLRSYGFSGIPITWWFSKIRRHPYPTATSRSAMTRVMSRWWELEARVPTPIGTSLLCDARIWQPGL